MRKEVAHHLQLPEQITKIFVHIRVFQEIVVILSQAPDVKAMASFPMSVAPSRHLA